MEKQHIIEITDKESCQRLDKVVSKRIQDLSRSRVQSLIKNGEVKINQNVIWLPKQRVEPGDIVTLTIPEPSSLDISPSDIPLDFIYQDEHIAVINKQPGLVVHPGAGQEQETLVHALLYHCKDLSGIGGEIRPGIVHRLDKDTSGIIVCAKNDAAHIALADQFRKGRVSKTYLAIVTGHMSDMNGRINGPIGRHPIHRKKMSINIRSGRNALTDWSVKEKLLCGTLLEVRIYTGRTHQIRVHMQSIGHPILGDALYGGPTKLMLESETVYCKRQMLHAQRLILTHPATGERMEFRTPVPEDMEELMGKLAT